MPKNMYLLIYSGEREVEEKRQADRWTPPLFHAQMPVTSSSGPEARTSDQVSHRNGRNTSFCSQLWPWGCDIARSWHWECSWDFSTAPAEECSLAKCHVLRSYWPSGPCDHWGGETEPCSSAGKTTGDSLIEHTVYCNASTNLYRLRKEEGRR